MQAIFGALPDVIDASALPPSHALAAPDEMIVPPSKKPSGAARQDLQQRAHPAARGDAQRHKEYESMLKSLGARPWSCRSSAPGTIRRFRTLVGEADYIVALATPYWTPTLGAS